MISRRGRQKTNPYRGAVSTWVGTALFVTMSLTPEEKKRLFGLFSNVKNDLKKDNGSWQRNTNSDILIVDGTNTFLRCWSAIPSMGDNGDHNGGVVGFLKSVGAAIKLLHPTRCIVVFDGAGGSFKRRKLFPQYKERRAGKMRLNRSYEDNVSGDEEERSRTRQYLRLVDYLQYVPINILSVDHVEADDVIAFLATETFKDSKNVSIMSSDRDFLQLTAGNIRVWSPTKKRLYGPAEVLQDYGIHPNNFVMFRAMDGDDSDNIDGIEGAGPKTIVKCFPFLCEERIYTLDEVVKHAEANIDRYKVYERVVNGRSILERNIALMQLRETSLTTISQLYCTERLETANIPKLDRGAFIKMLAEDRMVNNFPSYQTWLTEIFGAMDSVTRKS